MEKHRVLFKHALLIEGVFYSRGISEVSQKRLEHPHFAHYAKLGLVCDPDDKESENVEVIETPAARSKRLHEMESALEAKKLALREEAEALRKEKELAGQKPEEPPVDELPPEAEKPPEAEQPPVELKPEESPAEPAVVAEVAAPAPALAEGKKKNKKG